MNINMQLAFLDNLQLEPSKQRYSRAGNSRAVGTGEPNILLKSDQAVLSDKSIFSFISSASVENQKSVINTTLLAQLAANKRYPDESDLLKWYDVFIETLEKVGWVVESSDLSVFQGDESLFEMDNVVIDILVAAFGQATFPLIQKILGSIKQLSNSADRKIKAFETNSHSTTKGCFQLGMVAEENDTIALNLGTFMITSANNINTVLFFKFSSNHTKLEYNLRKATLDMEVYQLLSKRIWEKIKDYYTESVTSIDI